MTTFQEQIIFPYTENPVEIATLRGNLKLLKYYHSINSKYFNYRVMDEAAQNGNLEIVKWLHENRTEGCKTFATNWAVKNGHSEIVGRLTKLLN